MAGPWSLIPALEVRVLAPELCTGRQVARHVPARRGTWVRLSRGARSVASPRLVVHDGEDTALSLRKRGLDARTRHPRQRQAPVDGSDPTLRTSEVWFNSTPGYSLGGGARCAACFGYRTLGWFDSSRLDHAPRTHRSHNGSAAA